MSAQATAAQIPQFDAAARQELEGFLEQEAARAKRCYAVTISDTEDCRQAKAKLQASIHELTDKCWNKCITGGISTKFSRGEASCLENCVDRFLDSSLFMVKQIESQKQHM